MPQQLNSAITAAGVAGAVGLGGVGLQSTLRQDTVATVDMISSVGAGARVQVQVFDGVLQQWSNVAAIDLGLLGILQGGQDIVLTDATPKRIKIDLSGSQGVRVYATLLGAGGTVSVSIQTDAFFVNAPTVFAVPVGVLSYINPLVALKVARAQEKLAQIQAGAFVPLGVDDGNGNVVPYDPSTGDTVAA